MDLRSLHSTYIKYEIFPSCVSADTLLRKERVRNHVFYSVLLSNQSAAAKCIFLISLPGDYYVFVFQLKKGYDNIIASGQLKKKDFQLKLLPQKPNEILSNRYQLKIYSES